MPLRTQVCQADELVLFERATFLVISNAVLRPHTDVHRFEKVSNIIKQFKLSCSKMASHFATMQVRPAVCCRPDSHASRHSPAHC